MLQRFALAAAPDEFAKGVHFRRRKHPLKLKVQPHARLLEQVRQQQFRLQPGRIYPLLAQELRAALNGFKNRHADKATHCARRSKPKRDVARASASAPGLPSSAAVAYDDPDWAVGRLFRRERCRASSFPR